MELNILSGADTTDYEEIRQAEELSGLNFLIFSISLTFVSSHPVSGLRYCVW